MCLFKARNCDRGSKWAKPCSEFLHSALLLRKILRGWENSFKTGPSPAVTSRDWQNSEYCVAVQKHWQKGGDGEYQLVAVPELEHWYLIFFERWYLNFLEHWYLNLLASHFIRVLISGLRVIIYGFQF